MAVLASVLLDGTTTWPEYSQVLLQPVSGGTNCPRMSSEHLQRKETVSSTSPPLFLKRPCNGKEMAGTNEFAFFRCRSIRTGKVPESGQKKFEKCLLTGTRTKIYFSGSGEQWQPVWGEGSAQLGEGEKVEEQKAREPPDGSKMIPNDMLLKPYSWA